MSTTPTVHKALLARLEARPGKEAAVADFLASAVALANQEQRTVCWFALQMGPSSFGVFDAFADEAGRQAHLNGPIAQALMARADELFSRPPQIDPVDLLAAKLG
ncbi:putative quinol monooxygenase [Piscinibacter terrae]|uniref:Antibiotic biosynthesis monooxygenase n=1 Tax=Piscinibacter terrae TaxID=2496871 RepID=A0A3N7HQS6_9BURK|nr:antibiotic biosynthesis monooxygenase [Albitalea terrae]RQP24043.1 antibiotic biosynthesis monooxygenase [Albitalea terrae]